MDENKNRDWKAVPVYKDSPAAARERKPGTARANFPNGALAARAEDSAEGPRRAASAKYAAAAAAAATARLIRVRVVTVRLLRPGVRRPETGRATR